MALRNYVALSIALIMVFSSIPVVDAATNGVISPAQADLHGPRVNKVLFTVITSDSTLYNSLSAGTIQGPEWTFTTGSFTSAKTDNNLVANTSLGYTFDGIGFNMLRPVTNSTHFRRAMAYLTDYSFIESTVLSGVAGAAQPDLFPCLAYPSACNTNIATYPLSMTNAVKELKLAGLTEGNTTSGPLSSITWLYNGQPFTPKFIYRSDDPLRTGVATSLINNAKAIGLQFNAVGTSKATPLVYSPSAAAALKPGVYNAATGYNTPPQFNYSAAGSTDTWDMYTFGWITSADYNWAFSFLNSQNVATSLNFLNYYNQTMDFDTNAVQYASTIQAANAAAQKVDEDNAVNLPYLMSFYQNTLWADYVNGWTGYVNVPAYGPNAIVGTYYTLLNVQPVVNGKPANGGTFNYAIHQAADAGGMNPLYNTNWQWQADIWGEIYDTPLATPPAQTNVALALINWMTTSYNVAAFNGKTGTSPGWFQMQGKQGVANNIVNGDVITLNFAKNITWTDHVPLTAADYNFSLFAQGVSAPDALPDIATPVSGTLSGPSGLWATYIPPNNPYQLQIYVNSTSVWNIPTVTDLAVMPWHIFKYFNIDKIATATAAMDTTLPYAQATANSQCNSPCTFLTSTSAPTWLQYLPNLEVGSGPFSLRAFSATTGAGELDKNVNYFRSAWKASAATGTAGTPYTLTEDINETIYNAGSSAMGGVPSGQTGVVPIANATGTVTVISPSGSTVTSVPLSGGTNGVYTASIPTTGLGGGTYELVTNATYNFLGLARTWYQANGLALAGGATSSSSGSSSSSTSSSSSSSTTTSSTDYTNYIIGGVIVVVVIALAAVFARRRR
ncbi:MAG TPA: ABC transporter substrate-binding protein [Nitrososphaerales archaeon]|nr:ABC transporter substrate-binding protein [Nitrososphaerales archaeon]